MLADTRHLKASVAVHPCENRGHQQQPHLEPHDEALHALAVRREGSCFDDEAAAATVAEHRLAVCVPGDAVGALGLKRDSLCVCLCVCMHV